MFPMWILFPHTAHRSDWCLHGAVQCHNDSSLLGCGCHVQPSHLLGGRPCPAAIIRGECGGRRAIDSICSFSPALACDIPSCPNSYPLTYPAESSLLCQWFFLSDSSSQKGVPGNAGELAVHMSRDWDWHLVARSTDKQVLLQMSPLRHSARSWQTYDPTNHTKSTFQFLHSTLYFLSQRYSPLCKKAHYFSSVTLKIYKPSKLAKLEFYLS